MCPSDGKGASRDGAGAAGKINQTFIKRTQEKSKSVSLEKDTISTFF